MDEALFIVQPYRAKAERLIGEPAQFFIDERAARRAAWRLARFRAGVVVAAQRGDATSGRRERPSPIAVHGRVPEAWGLQGKAA